MKVLTKNNKAIVSNSNKAYAIDDQQGEDYFYMEPYTPGTSVSIYVTRNGDGPDVPFKYSLDKENWTDLQLGTRINITQKTYFTTRTEDIFYKTNNDYLTFKAGNYPIVYAKIGGNIQSILPGKNTLDICLDYGGYKLFYNAEFIRDASDLRFPSRVCSYGFENLFAECQNLLVPPTSLMSTTLDGRFCYSNMFSHCTSLVSCPAIPATVLSYGCYEQMFSRCSALTEPPIFPASVELKSSCYSQMFNRCTNLIKVPVLPYSNLAPYCYERMFYSCTNLYISDSPVSGVAEQTWTLPADTTIQTAYRQDDMFTGCLGTRSSDNFTPTVGMSYTYYTQNTPVSA